MKRAPRLKGDDIRVLQAISGGGIVRGAELMRRMGYTNAQQLMAPVRDLLKHDLIEISGNPFDEQQILSAVFSTKPSKSAFVQHTLKEAL